MPMSVDDFNAEAPLKDYPANPEITDILPIYSFNKVANRVSKIIGLSFSPEILEKLDRIKGEDIPRSKFLARLIKEAPDA
jgi:hypothetical protein